MRMIDINRGVEPDSAWVGALNKDGEPHCNFTASSELLQQSHAPNIGDCKERGFSEAH